MALRTLHNRVQNCVSKTSDFKIMHMKFSFIWIDSFLSDNIALGKKKVQSSLKNNPSETKCLISHVLCPAGIFNMKMVPVLVNKGHAHFAFLT